MRPLLPGDLDTATRALIPLPPEIRAAEAARLVTAADTADRWRKRLGRAHPRLGDGTLMAAALLTGPGTPVRWCDDGYCAALATLLQALAARRQTHQAR
jgi:hypothetical protein